MSRRATGRARRVRWLERALLVGVGGSVRGRSCRSSRELPIGNARSPDGRVRGRRPRAVRGRLGLRDRDGALLHPDGLSRCRRASCRSPSPRHSCSRTFRTSYDGRAPPTTLAVAAGSGWFALGPATVMVVAGEPAATAKEWPLLLALIAAQFAVDFVSTAAREWAALSVRPSALIEPMKLVFTVDLLLAPIGFLAAIAAKRPRARCCRCRCSC